IYVIVAAEIDPPAGFADAVPKGVPVFPKECEVVPVATHRERGLMAVNKKMRSSVKRNLSIEPFLVYPVLVCCKLVNAHYESVLVRETVSEALLARRTVLRNIGVTEGLPEGLFECCFRTNRWFKVSREGRQDETLRPIFMIAPHRKHLDPCPIHRLHGTPPYSKLNCIIR